MVDQVDKLLDISQMIQMTLVPYLFLGQSSRLCGAPQSTDRPKNTKTSQEQECPCTGSVSIMPDKIISLELLEFVERSLQLCVWNVFSIKLTLWQVMETKQHIIQHRNLQDVHHMR